MYAILQKLKRWCIGVMDFFQHRFIRPVKKYHRRRQYFQRQSLVREATGELVDKFEPLMMKILDETISEYREVGQRNHYTIQACHDIRKLYEVKIKSFIVSKK